MVWLDSVDETKNDPAILRYVAVDPNVCGASIVVLWSEIDKGPTHLPYQYDFSPIEQAMKPWIAAHKIVNLLLAGVDEKGATDRATPSWVLAQTGPNHVDLVPCSASDVLAPPTPVYWEPGYLTPWHKFISRVIKRYGSNPNVGYMRFGLGAGAEDFPQHGADGPCFSVWHTKFGLSAKSWARYSARLTSFIAAAARRDASTAQQLVALNPFSDPEQPFDVQNEVAGVAASNGVGFGTENLGSGDYGRIVEKCTSKEYWCHAFTTHAGQVPLQFQPINFTLEPGTHVLPLPKLLAYALYNDAQVFEIYPEDWLTADDPHYGTYRAHHAAWQRAFTKAAAILGGT